MTGHPQVDGPGQFGPLKVLWRWSFMLLLWPGRQLVSAHVLATLSLCACIDKSGISEFSSEVTRMRAYLLCSGDLDWIGPIQRPFLSVSPFFEGTWSGLRNAVSLFFLLSKQALYVMVIHSKHSVFLMSVLSPSWDLCRLCVVKASQKFICLPLFFNQFLHLFCATNSCAGAAED